MFFIVFFGVSGVGKSTIARHMVQKFPKSFSLSVSHTTRFVREKERDGQDYFFVTKDEFISMINNNSFAEYTEYDGNFYGTTKSFLEKRIKSGTNVVLDLDYNGVKSLKKLYKDNTVAIHCSPPSFDILKQRLESRGDNKEDTERRLFIAKQSLQNQELVDLEVINDDLSDCVKEVIQFLRSLKIKLL
ncbi:guanylate kinase [Candidatus Sneabacter namystus]|uniref:Guanylate kinase n=1 Tax=Candidatus Sneabacter namystus TaxID=2601646 RepID=A0A5C0UIT9_9RICK|nr:guanylate kinase [Candidatus Sneabacter namystus]QEK39709.1 guanylate kinase [Candidatus Sneabacter namystus]